MQEHDVQSGLARMYQQSYEHQLFIEMEMPYDSNLAIDREVAARLKEIATTAQTEANVDACQEILGKALLQLHPDWRLRMFGSYETGLFTNDSDIDATCFREGLQGKETLVAKDELRAHLVPFLEAHPEFEVMADIFSARIPILKLRFRGTLDVDLSIQNTEPFRNTQLVRSYMELPGVWEFVMAIKLWAKAEGIVGATEGHLSSYSITLMALYFLQSDDELGMPCLPVHAFDGSENWPPEANVDWALDWPSSLLLNRFFWFFSHSFRWGDEVVAIHVPQRTSRLDNEKLKGVKVERLHLSDPFLLDRNLNYVLGPQQEMLLQRKIYEASIILQSGMTPPGLRPTAFAMRMPEPFPMPDNEMNPPTWAPKDPPGFRQVEKQVKASGGAKAYPAKASGVPVPKQAVAKTAQDHKKAALAKKNSQEEQQLKMIAREAASMQKQFAEPKMLSTPLTSAYHAGLSNMVPPQSAGNVAVAKRTGNVASSLGAPTAKMEKYEKHYGNQASVCDHILHQYDPAYPLTPSNASTSTRASSNEYKSDGKEWQTPEASQVPLPKFGAKKKEWL